MRNTFTALVILLGSAVSGPHVSAQDDGGTLPPGVSDGAQWSDPQPGELVFDVSRNGGKFGAERMTFERRGEDMVITRDVDYKVSFGPIVPFRYRHDAIEVWRDGRLISLESETLKDGDDLTMSMMRGPEGSFAVRSNLLGDAQDVAGDMLATSWWNSAVMTENQLVNTETGEVLDVSVSKIGRETVQTGQGPVDATLYRVEASLTLDLWYADDGRWVKMSFNARGDNFIEYTLQSATGG